MREESTQFSLKELMKLEDERIAEQKRAREEEARKREAEQQAKIREEAETKDRARRAELDEVARREAMQKAVVEQARLEVEARARADERERERRHELELAQLRQNAPPPPPTSIAPLAGSALLGGVAMFAVVLGLHFGVTKPATDRHMAELGARMDASEQRAGELEGRIEEQRRVIAERDRLLAEAQREIDSLRAQCPTVTAKKGGVPTTTRSTTKAPEKSPTSPTDPNCKFDPMCFAVQR